MRRRHLLHLATAPVAGAVARPLARFVAHPVGGLGAARLAGLTGAGLAPALSGAATPADALVERLRAGGVVLLLRHSTTDPGVGDPPGFRLDECRTQRNLSEPGRQLAQRIGAWTRANALTPSRVRSSAWCRCLDTGRLAFGSAEPWPALNSFFGEEAARERQSAALAAAAPTIPAGRFEVWVTHQVNITALTGQFADMGAGCVIAGAPGAPVRVLGAFALS